MPEYIEREALIEVFRRIEKDKTDCFSPFANTLIDFIKLVPPTADVVEVKHGKWLMRGGWFRCSECDEKAELRDVGGTGGFSHEYEQIKSNYCPNCGAKMDKE